MSEIPNITPRALLVGFFSTVGDIDCLHIVRRWLDKVGIQHDTAPFARRVHLLLPTSLDLRNVEPARYTHLVVICGPCWEANHFKKNHRLDRFDHCRRIGINLTMVDALERWNPFDDLFERDSNRMWRPDLSFLETTELVPVAGRCLIARQAEYGNRQRHDEATARIDSSIVRNGLASVDVDTRWCHPSNPPGQKTPAAIASVLARSDFLITTRLHGLVFALRAGVPVIAIDPILGGDKVSAQAKALGWPLVSRIEDLTDDWMDQSIRWCLTPEARECVRETCERARHKLAGLEGEFLAAMARSASPGRMAESGGPRSTWFKRLGARLREMRPYFSPRHHQAYAALVKRGLDERKPGEPVVCFDLSNPAVDAVGGRYYFGLVKDVIDAGYFPVFTRKFGTLSTFGTSRLKSLLLGERLGVVASPREIEGPFTLITDTNPSSAGSAEHVIRVDYAWRLCRSDGDIALPFFVHPSLTSKTALPYDYPVDGVRTIRLFFGGNTSGGVYDKNVIGNVYQMLNRREVLDVAERAVPFHRPASGGQWLESREPQAAVLCESHVCRIPQDRWLESLSRADFFLACPGERMPLCHNLIESLAAGCIPILQYASYLSQPLEDGVNCLAFHDAASLESVIRKALEMDPHEVVRLRAGVAAYYSEHLAPGCFAKRMLGGFPKSDTLLINAYRVPRI